MRSRCRVGGVPGTRVLGNWLFLFEIVVSWFCFFFFFFGFGMGVGKEGGKVDERALRLR